MRRSLDSQNRRSERKQNPKHIKDTTDDNTFPSVVPNALTVERVSTTATLGTEVNGRCREVAVMGR